MKIKSALLRRCAPLFVMAASAAVSMPAVAQDGALPGGTWRQTCQDATIQNGMLYARCRQDNGQYRQTSALLRSTCQSYSNRNGQLYCEHGNAQAGSRWSGSYEQSCRDIAVDKQGRLSASCPKANGKFNRTNIGPGQCPSYRAANKNGKLVCEGQGSASNYNRWEGSYAQSCRDMSVNSAGTLTATCQARNGNWQRTSLAAGNCTNNRAANDDGRLVCESQRAGNNRWDGSFKGSCRDVYMDGDGTLTATCQSSSGAWVPSRLSARNCDSYRAGNNNGQLVCEGQGNVNNRWEGSFAQSCREISTNSNGALTATCQTRNGNWQRTSLEARQCNSLRAGNDDGRLFCEN